MVAKVNQDSFQVQKGFPNNTRAFNWMFEVFDGHGPHGEIVSQHAAKLLPNFLDQNMSGICQSYSGKIQDAYKTKNRELISALLNQRNKEIQTLLE